MNPYIKIDLEKIIKDDNKELIVELGCGQKKKPDRVTIDKVDLSHVDIVADTEDGLGVDVVLDLTEDFGQIDLRLCGQRFGAIFCLSVLEHCEQPFKMAENLTLLLEPKGQICISAPFSWKIHGYPNDYWRFTPESIKKLFPRIKFDMGQSLDATSKLNDFSELNDELGKISFSFIKHRASGHILRGISAKFLKALSRVGILNWLTGYRHVFAPTGVLMIGKPEKK